VIIPADKRLIPSIVGARDGYEEEEFYRNSASGEEGGMITK